MECPVTVFFDLSAGELAYYHLEQPAAHNNAILAKGAVDRDERVPVPVRERARARVVGGGGRGSEEIDSCLRCSCPRTGRCRWVAAKACLRIQCDANSSVPETTSLRAPQRGR